MNVYWKAITGMLIALTLWICLQRQEKDMALILSSAACILGISVALKALSPVLDLLRQLESLGRLENGILSVLLKVAGIGLVTELSGMICADAGNGALEKTIRFLGSVTMLTLSVPVFRLLLSLIHELMGAI